MSAATTFAGPIYEPSAIDGRPEIREACGVVGIYGSPDEVVNRTYFALFAVQHRGQESAGIAVARGNDLWLHRDMGLVSHVLTDEVLDGQRGHLAIGHCRYSTTGSSNHENIQPVEVSDRALDRLSTKRFLPDVARDQQASAALLFDQTLGFFGIVMFVEIDNGCIGTFLCVGDGNGPPGVVDVHTR